MGDSVALSDVAAALDLGNRSHVALVGGGGKTTLLGALANRLPGRVLLTTTTKTATEEHHGLPVLVNPTNTETADALTAGPTVVWGGIDGSKAVGIDASRCDSLFEVADHLLVEADGSRGRPFKAPAWYEPVVPSTATMVLHVMGADALGRVIADQCHRPLRVAALAGCRADVRLSPSIAADVLLHEQGMRKAVPVGSQYVVAVTKVDDQTAVLVGELVSELRLRQPDIAIIQVRTTA